jgi:hypothetical protein
MHKSQAAARIFGALKAGVACAKGRGKSVISAGQGGVESATAVQNPSLLLSVEPSCGKEKKA